MSQATEYHDILQDRFNQMTGLPVTQLLNDIEKDAPSGSNLKHNGVYSFYKSRPFCRRSHFANGTVGTRFESG